MTEATDKQLADDLLKRALGYIRVGECPLRIKDWRDFDAIIAALRREPPSGMDTRDKALIRCEALEEAAKVCDLHCFVQSASGCHSASRIRALKRTAAPARVAEGEIMRLKSRVAEAAKAWLIRYEDEVRDEAEEAPCKNLVAAVDALVAAEVPAKEQPMERLRCHSCGNEIDPETCGCGDSRESHGQQEHPFVPMGCTCYYAKEQPGAQSTAAPQVPVAARNGASEINTVANSSAHEVLTSAGVAPAEPTEGEMAEMVKRLRKSIPHYNCEDCFYSCATLCCDDKRRSDKCDCGADEENVLRTEAATLLSHLAQRPEQSGIVINWTTDGCPKHHGQPWTFTSLAATAIGKRCPLCDPLAPQSAPSISARDNWLVEGLPEEKP